MEQLVEKAVGLAVRAGAQYADARWVRRRRQFVSVKNRGVHRLVSSESAGIGVRVLCDGAWGFAATFDTSEGGVRAAVIEAVEIAKASARLRPSPVELSPVDPVNDEAGHWAQINPFEIPLREKLDLLMACDAAMDLPGIVVRQSDLRCSYVDQHLATSEGTRIHQQRITTGAMLQATAAAPGEVQRRSYPSSHGGQT
ncbi:MAG: TldD/PmbA family protein, partial [Armatimonadetes bacterium]|nr:TldD/PmbA family protein [Armatimonadota bacterium]